MSENAVNVAIRRMGYGKEQMTAHGFRSMASSLLNEAGHRQDVIEAQLAHTSADKIRAIYNRAQYMDERRALMQSWADMLDAFKTAAVAQADQRTP
jgi:integrase